MIWIDLAIFVTIFFGIGWLLRIVDEVIYGIKKIKKATRKRNRKK